MNRTHRSSSNRSAGSTDSDRHRNPSDRSRRLNSSYRSGRRDASDSARLTALETRLDATERRLLRIVNALNYVARRSSDLSVGCPCTRCDRSLLIVDNGMIVCPCCQYQRHL